MSGFVQLELPLPPAPMRLSAADRELKALLGRLAGKHSEVWHATETIAQRLGITVRAAQLRIQRLEILGLVKRTWDYTKNTRRRLVLLWRFVSAAPFVESAQGSSPTAEIPPICASAESEEEKEVSGYAAPEPPPPPPTMVVEKEEPGRATPEAAAELKAKAADAMPADAGAGVFALSLTKDHPTAWVHAALARLTSRIGQVHVRDPRGYLCGVLAGYRKQGGPPPPAAPPVAWTVPQAWIDELPDDL